MELGCRAPIDLDSDAVSPQERSVLERATDFLAEKRRYSETIASAGKRRAGKRGSHQSLPKYVMMSYVSENNCCKWGTRALLLFIYFTTVRLLVSNKRCDFEDWT